MDPDSGGQGWHRSCPSASHPRLAASGGSPQVPAVPAPHPTEVMMTTGKDDFRGWCCRQPGADTPRARGEGARDDARHDHLGVQRPASARPGPQPSPALWEPGAKPHCVLRARHGAAGPISIRETRTDLVPGHRRSGHAGYGDRAFQLQYWGTQTRFNTQPPCLRVAGPTHPKHRPGSWSLMGSAPPGIDQDAGEAGLLTTAADNRPATHLPSTPRAQHAEILMPG